ncbi:MAG: UDP-N-acetylglucosamine--N-acetylmuramyl-(pentapeptide) pyrophosphoryl-undecaprenol N-acetylglucosamine transferase [Acidimicrobiia bacterium]|nr:UDP-N-acetylglucosamine--N-acetylmuramyl-(pentapeptide) pyrophosphoryl-undecaprenol N-acetylglucosamine transferase [Acidimicrobiia bacterium]
MSQLHAVVTGGGTAGHVLPALAVAEALVGAGHDPATIRYVGAQRGIETELLPETQFPYTFHDVVGLQRSLTRRNLAFVPKMFRSSRDAVREFRANRPQVVVSVGGYASMPSVFAARRLGIPIVVVSYDHTPGRASRLSAHAAAACAVAFDDSPLPRATMTGAPVRQAILDVDRARGRANARDALGLPPDAFVLAVIGGSQGSAALNEATAHYLAAHAGDADLAVRHIVGERFADDVRVTAPDLPTPGAVHQIVGYEREMPLVYEAADLLVGRGGASTVHEVAVTGTPAILVPWAASADDHQTENVRWLSSAGGAVLLPESEIAGLGDLIESLRSDDTVRAGLAASARTMGVRHRSGALAALIDRVALTSDAS